jgi:DNA-directed RNA polymerase subunit L
MEIKKIKHTSSELLIEVKGENETLLNPIVQELLKIDDVDYASIETDHPNAPYRRLFIRLMKGSKSDPLALLDKSIKQVKKVTKEFRTELEKAIPETKK